MPQRLARALLAILLILAGSVLNSASQEGSTARVSGRVTRIDTGAPLERATVTLLGLSSGVGKSATSGASGDFEIRDIPAGEYRLLVTGSGWVSSDATPARPQGLGKPIKLTAGQQLKGLELTVARMPAIEGRVLDQNSAPLSDVPVSVVQMRQLAGRPVMAPVATGTAVPANRTDADGRFRFADLPPGDYYVLATAGPFGEINPSKPVPVSEKLLPYVPTFFPGADRIAGARSVRVQIGIDAFDVTFSLIPAAPVTMSGRVAGANGSPVPDANLILIPTEGGGIQTFIAARATSDASGAFVFPAIPAGTYVLQCYTRETFGSRPVVIPAIKEGVKGVEVIVRPPINARGLLRFEGGSPPKRESVIVTFSPTDFMSGPISADGRQVATLHDDWAFEFDNLAWFGLIRVHAPAGWALKSVKRNGRDISDEPSDFQTADVDGLELLMTSHLASIAGTVSEANGAAAPSYVLVLPEDGTKVFQPLRSSRGAATTSDGSFKITGLLPGRYRIAAVAMSSLEATVNSADLLASLYVVASPVSLAEDESKTMTLKLVRR